MTSVLQYSVVEPKRRKPSGRGHILISGTGRAGTTLLVRYFTALGFDTGFSEAEAKQGVSAVSNAGLEHIFSGKPVPHVIKSPWYTETIGECLDRGTLDLECCIVPVRRLFDAAESRRRAGLLWLTDDPAKQEVALAVQLHKLIEVLVRCDVPLHFLHFPTFAESLDALYEGLKPLLDWYQVSRNESDSALRSIVDLNLIHKF